jgi:hypothetical protein
MKKEKEKEINLQKEILSSWQNLQVGKTYKWNLQVEKTR